MTKPGVEVADVVRQASRAFLAACGPSTSAVQRRVLRDIAGCRTAALGGHVAQCDGCGHRQIAYNSCRNRHCPKCQAGARFAWTEAREAELLPVPYMHVVFTLPAQLAPIALQNKRVVYRLLFQAAAQTLQEVAADPNHLGARIGLLAVLHTWGQNLMHHPHVHCVVPAGGISPDKARWIPCNRSASSGQLFFLPVRVLSRVFRGKFLHGLKQARTDGRLSFHGRLRPLAESVNFERFLNTAVRQEWVVYAKRPFGGPRQVLRYLARYTHRVAISNHRLHSFSNGQVSFDWKDYADGSAHKVMTLDAVEFLRRFLLHTLPRGFRRIRYYGFMANRRRQDNLYLCRQLLGATDPGSDERLSSGEHVAEHPGDTRDEVGRIPCPICHEGTMVNLELLPPSHCSPLQGPHFLVLHRHPRSAWDTS